MPSGKCMPFPPLIMVKIILISKMNYTDLRLTDWVNQEWRNDRYTNQIAGVG